MDKLAHSGNLELRNRFGQPYLPSGGSPTDVINPYPVPTQPPLRSQSDVVPQRTQIYDTMTGRDRTAEFESVIRSLQSRQDPRNHAVARGQMKPSEFMEMARAIGLDISRTCAKLEKLAELARGKSLFGDPANEIQELTGIIKQDIAKLNSDIAYLQDRTKSRSGSQSKHQRAHAGNVLVSLQTKLVDMSKDFKSVLEMRTENLKQQKLRREKFSAVPLSVPDFSAGQNGSVLRGGKLADPGASVAVDLEGLAQQQSQMQMVDQTDTYIQERADAMQNIEQTIVELGGIFKQLAVMVKEQEEQMMRIDSNVSETQMNVEAAHGELLKYFKGITSNRWLMVKIFLVLIIFFIIFIVLVA